MGDSTYLTNPIERVPVVYMVGCSSVMHDEGEIGCNRSAILAVEIFVGEEKASRSSLDSYKMVNLCVFLP